MDVGDWASVTAAIIALFAAGVAIVQANAARDANAHAARSAKAAETQARAAEQQASEAKRANDMIEGAQHTERHREQREYDETAVVWRVTNVSPGGCHVRNVAQRRPQRDRQGQRRVVRLAG